MSETYSHVRIIPWFSKCRPPLQAGKLTATPQHQPFQDAQFDIFAWHPKFQSCVDYFLNHGQHSIPVQSVAALVNIHLPFQKNPPITSTTPSSSSSPGAPPVPATALLVPYVRRLVATGFDGTPVLHGFFGDDWPLGIGPLHEVERRNFLFAAKSDNWLKVKTSYDMADGQTVPFLRPLQHATEKEIQAAEATWSDWLAMQDWMLGPRAPPGVGSDDVRVKLEGEQS